LRQVLQNLVSNALKYRDRTRPLVLRITAASAQDGMSEIRVTDNGLGFDERHRERIFEPFERLHSHDEFEGSGIGLAICRKVMARHGGSITARGCPGDGAEFTLRLPARLPPPALPLPGLR
jgi:signal transduction histidine kinase